MFGHFFETSDDSALRRPFTVFGTTVRGRPVTLFDCHTRNLTTHLPGGKSAQITSYFGVVGGHFATRSEMTQPTRTEIEPLARMVYDMKFVGKWFDELSQQEKPLYGIFYVDDLRPKRERTAEG